MRFVRSAAAESPPSSSSWPEMANPREDVGKLKLLELQRECEVRGLDASGKKQELADRLRLALESEGAVSLPGDKVSSQEAAG